MGLKLTLLDIARYTTSELGQSEIFKSRSHFDLTLNRNLSESIWADLWALASKLPLDNGRGLLAELMIIAKTQEQVDKFNDPIIDSFTVWLTSRESSYKKMHSLARSAIAELRKKHRIKRVASPHNSKPKPLSPEHSDFIEKVLTPTLDGSGPAAWFAFLETLPTWWGDTEDLLAVVRDL